jgi:hypothetical protein
LKPLKLFSNCTSRQYFSFILALALSKNFRYPYGYGLQETRELDLLKAKVLIREQRLEMLRSLASTDDVDLAITRTVGATPEAGATLAKAQNGATKPKDTVSMPAGPKFKAVRQFTSDLIEFVGNGKSLEEVAAFYDKLGKTKGRDGDEFAIVRTNLWAIKAKSAFIENPKKGFYKATQAGYDFVASVKGEKPMNAASNSDSGLFNTQPVSAPDA